MDFITEQDDLLLVLLKILQQHNLKEHKEKDAAQILTLSSG